MNCPNCGGAIVPGTNRCRKCGTYVEQPSARPPDSTAQQPTGPAPDGVGSPEAAGPAVKSKIAAGVLGLFLGGLGTHRFYLGYTGIGLMQLGLWLVGLITLFFCIGWFLMVAAGIWGLIEGIMILTDSIDRDAQNRPLQQ